MTIGSGALVSTATEAGAREPGPPAPKAFPWLQPSQLVQDTEIHASRRKLSRHEIAAADVTNTEFGRDTLERIRETDGAINVDAGVYRVFLFGNQHDLVADASASFDVYEGKNTEGQTVYEVVSIGKADPVPMQAGYAVPPKSAFVYRNDGALSEDVKTWHRDWWWTVNKADNWKACSTCTPYDYYRYYTKMRAQVLQQYAGDPTAGYQRAWIETDRENTGWGSGCCTEFEPDQPVESYSGEPNVTVTVGFGTTYDFNIGIPPYVSAGGSVSTSYGGSMTASTENWHPVARSEPGSGGVQWCRYTPNSEFTGTKLISARVSVRVDAGAAYGGFRTLRGMEDEDGGSALEHCPTQI